LDNFGVVWDQFGAVWDTFGIVWAHIGTPKTSFSAQKPKKTKQTQFCNPDKG
jgi:hypothetical protein